MTKLIPVALLLLATSCNTPSNEPAAVTAETVAPAKHDYGIKAGYSTDFSLGDAAQGDIVIKLWKQFDENKIAEGRDNFADSVDIRLPLFSQKMQRDSMIVMITEERSKYSALTSSIDAIIPVKANDKDENAVLMWGAETATLKGKEWKKEIHEVWIFNKAGKVSAIEQYVRE